jgi:hypothetical protein
MQASELRNLIYGQKQFPVQKSDNEAKIQAKSENVEYVSNGRKLMKKLSVYRSKIEIQIYVLDRRRKSPTLHFIPSKIIIPAD